MLYILEKNEIFFSMSTLKPHKVLLKIKILGVIVQGIVYLANGENFKNSTFIFVHIIERKTLYGYL